MADTQVSKAFGAGIPRWNAGGDMPFWALFSLGDQPVSTAPNGRRCWKTEVCSAVTTAVIKVLSDLLQSDQRALTASPFSWARLTR